MGQAENKVKNDVLREMDPETERLFRINAGQFWAGDVDQRLPGGKVVLRNARVVRGAPEGFPDLVGWKTVVITEDMVGSKMAVFQGIELKSSKCVVSESQRRFGDLLARMGGFFKVVKK